jgi:hypothetical protein
VTPSAAIVRTSQRECQNSFAANGTVTGLLQSSAEKWNGTKWKVSPTPITDEISQFLGVTATSRAIFAVGDANLTPQDPQDTLVEIHSP